MKIIRHLLIAVISVLVFSAPIIATSGCTSAPSQRTNEVQTLKVVGAAVDGAMKIAANLYKQGKISDAKWQEIADLHDNKIQPAYNLAVAAVQADITKLAPTDLILLVSQLTELVSKLQ